MENPERFPIWRDMTAMRPASQPETKASEAPFLCLDAASYANGEVRVVDDGYAPR